MKGIKSLRPLMSLLVLGAVPIAAFAEETISQPITELRYQGSADYLYLIGAARWGAPSCPGAYYATVPAGTANANKLMTVILAAKAAGSNVSFIGTCSSDPLYFNISYVVVN